MQIACQMNQAGIVAMKADLSMGEGGFAAADLGCFASGIRFVQSAPQRSDCPHAAL